MACWQIAALTAIGVLVVIVGVLYATGARMLRAKPHGTVGDLMRDRNERSEEI